MISLSHISSGYSTRQSGCSHPPRMLSLWAVTHFTSKCKLRIFAHHSRPTRVYLSSPFVYVVYSIRSEGHIYIFTLYTLNKPVCIFASRHSSSFQLSVRCLFGVPGTRVTLWVWFSACWSLFFVPHRDVRITQTRVFLSGGILAGVLTKCCH